MLLTVEYLARRRQRFHEKSSGQDTVQSEEISNFKKIVCLIVCLIPILLGFIIPTFVLLNFVLSGFSIINFTEILEIAFSSIAIAAVSALVVMIISLLMIVVANYKSNSIQRILIFLE